MPSLIPESIRAFFGAFTGILLAFGGSIYYSDEKPRENLNKYLCCARLSLRLESLDALDPESLKSAMRSKAEPDEPLGHQGERYDNPLFHGIWWMDGNPGPEELLTMADGYIPPDYTPEPYQWIHLTTLDLEGGTWAYPDNVLGRSLFVTQCTTDVNPELRFNQDETRFLYQGSVSPNNEMFYIDENTYSKPILKGQAYYTLRRIVDANGDTTSNWPIWEAYASKRRRPRVLTYRRRSSSETCHVDFL